MGIFGTSSRSLFWRIAAVAFTAVLLAACSSEGDGPLAGLEPPESGVTLPAPEEPAPEEPAPEPAPEEPAPEEPAPEEPAPEPAPEEPTDEGMTSEEWMLVILIGIVVLAIAIAAAAFATRESDPGVSGGEPGPLI